MSRRTTLDAWTEICHSVFPKKAKKASVHPIHSCVINGVRHYVHAPDLPKQDPSYFERLVEFANDRRVILKPDRRLVRHEPVHGRRKRLLPIMFLALGLNASGVFAEQRSTERADTHDKVSLGLIPHNHSHASEHIQNSNLTEPQAKDPLPTLDFDKEASKRIKSILAKHLITQGDDPTSLGDDIALLANYYATHPEAARLIESIADADWSLKYAPHTYQTDIEGSRINIDSITVYFDPRSGAQLKFYDRCSDKAPFCVASPADALLHELLHVQSIVQDTSGFLASGGMSATLYPAEHEHDTILKENILYASMTRRDNHPRPIRSEHSGRHVLVSCVTCVE